jgi:predicted phosphoribosyltransferase
VILRDRTAAGERLAQALKSWKDKPCVVLALPRGGIPVAVPIAAALSAPLDLLIVRKIGVPWHRELAMGAVVQGDPPVVVRNEDVIRSTGVSQAQFELALEQERDEAQRRFERYLHGRTRPDLRGRTAIIVDDGIATGATMRAAIKAVRERAPAAIVLAIPVAAASSIEELREDVDDIVCLMAASDLSAIGTYYDDFHQVNDIEVIEALQTRSAA